MIKFVLADGSILVLERLKCRSYIIRKYSEIESVDTTRPEVLQLTVVDSETGRPVSYRLKGTVEEVLKVFNDATIAPFVYEENRNSLDSVCNELSVKARLRNANKMLSELCFELSSIALLASRDVPPRDNQRIYAAASFVQQAVAFLNLIDY
jgi:hypothetical protein